MKTDIPFIENKLLEAVCEFEGMGETYSEDCLGYDFEIELFRDPHLLAWGAYVKHPALCGKDPEWFRNFNPHGGVTHFPHFHGDGKCGFHCAHDGDYYGDYER